MNTAISRHNLLSAPSALAIAVLGLSACVPFGETLASYGASGETWVLQEIDGAPFPATATLVFGFGGTISGEAPCNSYRGKNKTPYPWFDVEELAATRKVCPDLLAETKYLDTLPQMTESEVLGDIMILRNGSSQEMLFKADD